ncbi:hypothetical protein Ancab_003857 [Ancistrocladus abbreviatus]
MQGDDFRDAVENKSGENSKSNDEEDNGVKAPPQLDFPAEGRAFKIHTIPSESSGPMEEQWATVKGEPFPLSFEGTPKRRDRNPIQHISPVKSHQRAHGSSTTGPRRGKYNGQRGRKKNSSRVEEDITISHESTSQADNTMPTISTSQILEFLSKIGVEVGTNIDGILQRLEAME